MALDKLDKNYVPFSSGITYEQYILNFRAFPKDHPHILDILNIFQQLINSNKVQKDGSISNFDAYILLSFFWYDGYYKKFMRQQGKLTLGMGTHQRLKANSVLRYLDKGTLELIASYL